MIELHGNGNLIEQLAENIKARRFPDGIMQALAERLTEIENDWEMEEAAA